MTSDELTARLVAADPLPAAPALPDAVVSAAVAELRAAAPAPRPRRARRRRAAFLAVLALLVAVPSGAAAMEAAGIHTGFFPGAGDTESIAGEEYLDTSSPGIVAVVRDLTTEFRLPAGASWGPLLARWPAGERVLTQRSGLGAEVEWFARCRWEDAWLRAHAAGDAPAAAAAAAVLADPASSRYAAAAGGATAHLRRVAAAAVAGDPGPVREDRRANC